YNLTQGKESSEVLYFSANTKGIADVVTIHLRKRASIKKTKWDYDFADLAIKGRDSKGNIVTKYSIRKVSYREKNSIEKRVKKIDEIEVNDEEQVSNDSEENQTKLNF
ncbi:DNA gyrase/topoisomerase IV subunit A, partial [Flavobacteriaceae bacterium]|nr:DNA gyrase/topoisomerase IV subunit A [Flavobacteriaceae bacterium]